MDSCTFYRNKMEYSFGLIQGEPVVGLHRFESYRLIVPAVSCLLMSAESQEILEKVQSFIRNRKIPVHFEGKDQHGLRYLVIREGKNTGERLIHLVTSRMIPEIQELWRSVSPLITTALLSAHRGISPFVTSEEIAVELGRGYIHERMGDYLFRIGPYTFFQANTRGAEILFDTLRLWAEDLGANLIFDLYTGSAPIAIYLHRAGRKILAVESNPEAIVSARENLTMNGIEGVELIQAEVEGFLASTDLKPDLVILDPPRAGLHPRALKGLLQLKPRDLFYVSCNPATFLRDYEILREHGYSPQKGVPLDLFPRTYHLEFLCHLRLDSHR
jgi:23S rRNA (uracil-5-)-methyltransferase RumA